MPVIHADVDKRRSFLERIRSLATELKPRIVFPESGDERVLAAAEEMDRTGMAIPILVTDNSMLAEGSRRPDSLQSLHAADEPALALAHRLLASGGADACVAGGASSTRHLPGRAPRLRARYSG